MCNKPLKLFIAYSHVDWEYKDALVTRLEVMEQTLPIKSWSDNKIIAGDMWEEDITENLKDTDILLYLASDDSLASKNCNKELTDAHSRGMVLLPIVVRECQIEYDPRLKILEWLPSKKDGHEKAIGSWTNQDEAWANVVKGIRKAIEKLRKTCEKSNQQTEERTPTASSFNFANILLLFGHFQLAVNAYTELIKFARDDSTKVIAYRNRGAIKIVLGEYEEAIKDFNKVIEINPQDDIAYDNRGVAQHSLNQHEKAIKDHDKAIELNPKDCVAYLNRGISNAKIGKYKEAIEDYDKAIEINPQYVEAYNNRGTAKDKLEKYKEAIEDYAKVIELNPQYAIAYHNRGISRDKIGECEGAIEDFNKAIEINPQHTESYCKRGIIKHNLGRYKDAIEDYSKVIELNSKDAEAYFNRGVAYLALNKAHVYRGVAYLPLSKTYGARADLEIALCLATEQKNGEIVRNATMILKRLNKTSPP